jgi:hypothetical protein
VQVPDTLVVVVLFSPSTYVADGSMVNVAYDDNENRINDAVVIIVLIIYTFF